MNRVLITGGAGFIGGHLGRFLAEAGWEVDLLDDLSRGVQDHFLATLTGLSKVRLILRDLSKSGALDALADDYRVIYHLAAIAVVKHVLRQPYQVLAGNMAMLEAVIALGRRQRALSRLVFASTSEVYAGVAARSNPTIPTPEDIPLLLTDLAHPRTSYMLSKIYGEALCIHSGLPYTVFRLGNIYGPRMGLSHVIPELLARAEQAPVDGVLEVFSPEHRRTFCFIEDAVLMMVEATVADVGRNMILNLGAPGPEVAMKEVAARAAKAVGKPLRIQFGPTTPGSPVRCCPEMSRTFAIVAHRPGVTLEQGVARTLAYLRRLVW